MSEDFEAFLRAELAERAGRAPVAFDEGSLASAAIAGAGRIRRRRRISAAASGMGLIVLTAAAVVWHPWIHSDKADPPVVATTTEAQNKLSMEFVVQNGDTYNVLNENGEYIDLGVEEEPRQVFQIQDAYLVETKSVLSMVPADGSEVAEVGELPLNGYTKVNSVGDQFAIVTPTDADFTAEVYSLFGRDDPLAGKGEFETKSELTLVDWNDETAVFGASTNPVTGGNGGPYFFNEEFDWGLESVSAVGFETAVIFDYGDPGFVCVSDLNPVDGTASGSEQCGPLSAPEIKDRLMDASGDPDATTLVADGAESYLTGGFVTYSSVSTGRDLEDRYYTGERLYGDPDGEWEISYSSGDDTWMLLTANADEEATISELTPPRGALMPVLSYTS